jgi:hypothetical protein
LDADDAKVSSHGLFIELSNEAGKKHIYLLSSSHVVVWLIDNRMRVAWNGGSEYGQVKMGVTFSSDLYLDENYIIYGNRDVGLIRVEKFHGFKGNKPPFLVEEVSMTTRDEIAPGQFIECSGFIYTSGKIVSLAAYTEEDGRMLVDAMSAPGLSGAPCFCGNGSIAATLHGSETEESPTPFVYVDGLFLDYYTFKKVDSDKILAVTKSERYRTPSFIEEMGRDEALEAAKKNVLTVRQVAECVDYKLSVIEDLNLQTHNVDLIHEVWITLMKTVARLVLKPEKCFTELQKAKTLKCVTPFQSVTKQKSKKDCASSDGDKDSNGVTKEDDALKPKEGESTRRLDDSSGSSGRDQGDGEMGNTSKETKSHAKVQDQTRKNTNTSKPSGEDQEVADTGNRNMESNSNNKDKQEDVPKTVILETQKDDPIDNNEVTEEILQLPPRPISPEDRDENED